MKSQNHIYKTGIINVNTMNKSSGKKKKKSGSIVPI